MRPWRQNESATYFGVQLAVSIAIPKIQNKLRGFVVRGTNGNHQMADDVMQEFALRALERWESLRDVANINSWLSSIVRSTLADSWRRVVRNRETIQDPKVLAEHAALNDVDDAEAGHLLCGRLKSLLARCGGRALDLVRSIDVADETCRDAAIRLAIKPNALHVRLHRARHGLRAKFDEACMQCPQADGCDHWSRAMILRSHHGRQPESTL